MTTDEEFAELVRILQANGFGKSADLLCMLNRHNKIQEMELEELEAERDAIRAKTIEECVEIVEPYGFRPH